MSDPKAELLSRRASSARSESGRETTLSAFLCRLVRGENLSFDEASDFFRALTDFSANPLQIAGALTALAAKGETFEELAGMARAMREKAVKINLRPKNLSDIAGDESSETEIFNLSTAAALVAAGAGLAIAKHTNRAASSREGSADVLDKLGVKISCEPELTETALKGAGICFLFTPVFHPALRRVLDVRRTLGIQTSLNLLEVLANPADPVHRLIGVRQPSLVKPAAEALKLLGTERSWIVHGSDGLDAVTLAGETSVTEIAGNRIRSLRLAPEDFKIPRAEIAHLKTDSPAQSAKIIREVLASKRRDEARALIVLNAAAALFIAGIARDANRAARLAEQSIDSGQAQNKLERLVQATNKR